MINNIGKTSSVIRLTAGLSLLTLYFTEVLNQTVGTTVGTILFSFAGVLLISGIFRSDPLKFMVQKAKSKK